MTKPKTILIITLPEMGQANCQLATLYEYMIHPSPLKIHFLSHKEFTPRLKQFVGWASGQTETPNGVTIHEYESLGMVEATTEMSGGTAATESIVLHTPSFFGLWTAFSHIGTVLHPWNRSQTVEIFTKTLDVLNTVKPDIAQVDNLHMLARDACRKVGQDVFVVSPNTIKEVGMYAQSVGTLFSWGLPGSGQPIPLPWYLYPMFIILQLKIIFTFILSSGARKTKATRKELGCDFLPAVLDPDYPNELKIVCMTTPELDVRGVIPEKIVCVGPIVQYVESVGKKDEELQAWLEKRPTIMIVLGSHYRMDKDYADHVARALKIVCTTRKDVQVLWKFMRMEETETSDLGEVRELVEEGRVRVVDWLKADPAAVLQTGNVCLAINHGGSNSYHEALFYGVPQVVLASWFDCYDFAVRVGMFKIGQWGNKKAAPRVESNELATAILNVIGTTPTDPSAQATLERCSRYREMVRARGGREKAVEVVVGVMEGRAVERPRNDQK